MRRKLFTAIFCAFLTGAGGPPAMSQVPTMEAAPDTHVEVSDEPRDVQVDEESRVEVALPARYWEYRDRAALAQDVQRGGCGGGQLPEEVVWEIRHKDAECSILCLRTPRSFLLRGRSDLEAFMDARVEAIRGEEADGVEVVEAPGWSESHGVLVHRVAFRSVNQPRELTFLLVDYFLRRADGAQDCLHFSLSCGAAPDVFDQLKPEIEAVVASFRYTGPIADSVYSPDAPEDRLLRPEDATGGVRRQSWTRWVWPPLLLAAAWFLLRRRRRAAPS